MSGGNDVVAVGGDLEPATLGGRLRAGPVPDADRRRARVVVARSRVASSRSTASIVSRSLRRVLGRFEIRVDTAFEAVMRACADPRRPHGWIDESFVAAYCRLHELGIAHSVEAWRDGALAGGLYGVRIRGLFAGESMFHRVTNASKVALWAAVELLRTDGASLFDVQWTTPHWSRSARSTCRADVMRNSWSGH